MEKCEVINGSSFVDDRGVLSFVNDFDFNGVKRFYQVENHEKGFIRAWHGHRHEGKYAYVVKGSVWFGVINMDDTSIREMYVLSNKSPRILYIPPGNYNGFQTLSDDAVVIFFSTSTIKESADDDYRLSYDVFPIFNKNYR